MIKERKWVCCVMRAWPREMRKQKGIEAPIPSSQVHGIRYRLVKPCISSPLNMHPFKLRYNHNKNNNTNVVIQDISK